MKARLPTLLLALAGVALLAFWPRPEEADVVGAKARRAAVRAPAIQAPASAPAKATAGPAVRFADLDGDLFPAQTWRPPPPGPKPVKPPPPAPPEFFFGYFGRWLEGGKEVYFLKQGDQVMRVRVGEVVAGAWRLDRVEADGLVFTYLPLNMAKTLRTK
jgi:hypothetical protein